MALAERYVTLLLKKTITMMSSFLEEVNSETALHFQILFIYGILLKKAWLVLQWLAV